MEMDTIVMISGWIAFLGLAIYVLTEGKITWNMFMMFLNEIANDPRAIKVLWKFYNNIKDDIPSWMVKKLDAWFKEHGYPPEHEGKKKGKKDKKKEKVKSPSNTVPDPDDAPTVSDEEEDDDKNDDDEEDKKEVQIGEGDTKRPETSSEDEPATDKEQTEDEPNDKPVDKPKFKCPDCDQTFSNERVLEIHIKTRHKDKVHKEEPPNTDGGKDDEEAGP